MKKFILIALITVALSNTTAFSQNINLSPDSITTLLCKKWEVDYAMLGDMKIGRIPGAEELNYEFNKDKTFLLTSNDPNDKSKGTWAYDPKKKVIKLTVNGKSNTSIVSLKQGELVMHVDAGHTASQGPSDVTVVYKIKA